MNKIIASALAGIALLGYTSCSQSGYEVKVAYATPQEGTKTLYLMDGKEVVDSASVVNNKLTFVGQADSFQVYQLSEKKKGRYINLTKLFIQNDTKINVNVDKEIVVEDVEGTNTKYNAFIREYKAVNKEGIAQYRKMMEAKEDKEKISEFAESFNNKIDNLWKEAVKKNSDNMAGTAILADFCGSISDYATFKEMHAQVLHPEYFPTLIAQETFFKNKENTAEGKMFVDFGGKDLEGKAIKLSDFVGKGKYVLVDFWASWCGPCRGEIPNLIEVNKKFGGDKFIVLGVNVWDREKDFKKAMNDLKIDYAQIFTTDQQSATNLYGINGIPQIILFAPDGKILKRDLRGEAIAKTVQENLKK